MYKAPDVAINAIVLLRQRGIDVRLSILGDGKYRADLERMSSDRAVQEYVQFHGVVPSREVRAHLDETDLFIIPSRTEGLPRALIEAMARAVPSIGSTAGGIPELLDAVDLVPPGEVGTLADAIQGILSDPARMMRMSARNLVKARSYKESILRRRRVTFYQAVERATRQWHHEMSDPDSAS